MSELIFSLFFVLITSLMYGLGLGLGSRDIYTEIYETAYKACINNEGLEKITLSRKSYRAACNNGMSLVSNYESRSSE